MSGKCNVPQHRCLFSYPWTWRGELCAHYGLCLGFLLLCYPHSALLGSSEALRNHCGVTEWRPSEVGLMASLFRWCTVIISMPALATHTHPNHTGLLSRLLFAFLLFFSFLKPHYSGWRVLLLKRWLELSLAFTWTAKDVGSAFGGFPSVQSIQAAENHNKWSSESMQRRDIMV